MSRRFSDLLPQERAFEPVELVLDRVVPRLQLPQHGVRIAERHTKPRILRFELYDVGRRQRQTAMGTEQIRFPSTPDPLRQPAGSASSGGESAYPPLPPARCGSAPASPPSLPGPEPTDPCSRRLLPIRYPPVSNPRISSIVRRRLINTNHCPLAGSSPRDRRTRADNPSNEHRMSVGWVHSRIRPIEQPFDMTPPVAAAAPHPRQAQARPPMHLSPTKWEMSAYAPDWSAPRTAPRGGPPRRPPVSLATCAATGRMYSAPIGAPRPMSRTACPPHESALLRVVGSGE